MTFKEELYKLVFDKLLLGVILGVFALYGAKQLENHRADKIFYSELNKIRLPKIAEVWEEASHFEEKFNILYNEIEREKISMLLEGKGVSENEIYRREKIKPFLHQLSKSRAKFLSVIQKNRFYLGPKLRGQAFGYYRSLAFVDLYQIISLDLSTPSRNVRFSAK